MPTYEYQCDKCGIVEIFHGINEPNKTECPLCNSSIIKIFSACAAIISKGKSISQYNDCKGARTWRDINGDLHKVTSADGHKKTASVSVKKTRSDQQIEQMKKNDEAKRKNIRSEQTYKMYENRIKKNLKK